MMHTYLSEKDLSNIKRDQFISQMSNKGKKQKAIEFFITRQDDFELDCYYSNADCFRQGSCQLFALALHDTFGYTVYEISDNLSKHWFCKKTIGKDTFYIDVRGITNDFCAFIATLEYLYCAVDTSFEYCILQDTPDKDDYVHQFGLEFAKWIIDRDRQFYDVDHYIFMDNIDMQIKSL